MAATGEESRRSVSTGGDEDGSDSERGFIQASAVTPEDIEKGDKEVRTYISFSSLVTLTIRFPT